MSSWRELPRSGLTGQFDFTVTPDLTIDFATDGMPAVLSTPKLIGLIERTSRETLRPFLNEGFRTVGAEVNIRHLAPTPPGAAVSIHVRVTGVTEDRVQFVFEVHDRTEVISRGSHTRVVIDVVRFSRRLARKALPS